MLFDELGIYGWDVVEPLVLAAIVADLPVLLEQYLKSESGLEPYQEAKGKVSQ